jgi:hypothetical protein
MPVLPPSRRLPSRNCRSKTRGSSSNKPASRSNSARPMPKPRRSESLCQTVRRR